MNYEGLAVFGPPGRLGAFVRSIGIINTAANKRRNHKDRNAMRFQGRVKKFLTDRGFGFIECKDLSGDTFVHIKDIQDGLNGLEVGAMVSFELGEDRKGNGRQRAINVTLT
jgi:cold shock CspA family protein